VKRGGDQKTLQFIQDMRIYLRRAAADFEGFDHFLEKFERMPGLMTSSPFLLPPVTERRHNFAEAEPVTISLSEKSPETVREIYQEAESVLAQKFAALGIDYEPYGPFPSETPQKAAVFFMAFDPINTILEIPSECYLPFKDVVTSNVLGEGEAFVFSDILMRICTAAANADDEMLETIGIKEAPFKHYLSPETSEGDKMAMTRNAMTFADMLIANMGMLVIPELHLQPPVLRPYHVTWEMSKAWTASPYTTMISARDIATLSTTGAYSCDDLLRILYWIVSPDKDDARHNIPLITRIPVSRFHIPIRVNGRFAGVVSGRIKNMNPSDEIRSAIFEACRCFGETIGLFCLEEKDAVLQQRLEQTEPDTGEIAEALLQVASPVEFLRVSAGEDVHAACLRAADSYWKGYRVLDEAEAKTYAVAPSKEASLLRMEFERAGSRSIKMEILPVTRYMTLDPATAKRSIEKTIRGIFPRSRYHQVRPAISGP
jgi:hypothetical protein